MIYSQTQTDPKQVWWQLGTIIRCALGAGLHRAGHRLNLDPVEVQERRSLFWAIYVMDKILSNIVGLPSVLQDIDIDQPLPQPIDDCFITKERIVDGEHTCGISMRLFIRIIALAKIQSRIQKKLYKIVRTDMDVSKLAQDVAELDQEVVAWKESMTPDFDELKSESSSPVYAVFLHAQLVFHYTIIILHQQGLQVSLERTTRDVPVLSTVSAHPRILAGGALCVSSARSTIQLLSLVSPDIMQHLRYVFPVSFIIGHIQRLYQGPFTR